MVRVLVLSLAFTVSATAQTLTIDDGSKVTRKDTLKASLKLKSPVSAVANLKLRWTDSYGRVVAEESRRVRVDGETVPISLPLRRAVALQNFLGVELEVAGETVRSNREEFIVTPEPGWDDYQVIMYYPYDVRRRESLGRRGEYTFSLDRFMPTILSLTPASLAPPEIDAPAEAAPGTLVGIPVRIKGESTGTNHALRVRLLNPDDDELHMLTRTLAAPGGIAVWELPLAVNLPAGRYTLEAVDIATGAKSARPFSIRATGGRGYLGQ